jgi:hypothetical protein
MRQLLALAEHHADVIRAFAEAAAARADDLYAALADLVDLKEMKDQFSMMLLREEGGMGAEYDRRKLLAWERARKLVVDHDQRRNNRPTRVVEEADAAAEEQAGGEAY